MDEDISDEFDRGVSDYWACIVPDEYEELSATGSAFINDRRNISPYLLGWLTAGDCDNGINYFSED